MSVQTGVVSASQELLKYDNARKLTYQELLGSPEGIDVTKKEVGLTASQRQRGGATRLGGRACL